MGGRGQDPRMSERPTVGVGVGVALLAGTCGAVQPKLNAVLGERLDSALVASLVNFAVALVVVLTALALRPRTRALLAGIGAWPVPRWTMTAGLGGVMVVVAGVVTVRTIGVAVFSIAFFAGQIACGLVVDRIGVSPGGKRPVSSARLQAVALALAAVVLAQLGRSVGEIAPALVAFAFAAGAASAFQSAFNGRIALATGDPVAATALNIALGTTALCLLVGTTTVLGDPPAGSWPTEPWLYVGGVLGATVVFSLAVSSAALGVLRATLSMLAAQLIAALVVDWVVLGEPPTAGVITGGVLIIAAAARVGRGIPGPSGAPRSTRSRRSGRAGAASAGPRPELGQ
jgi:bacterial/archaeal transporter family-2 protein